jgi:DNA repair photolyase
MKEPERKTPRGRAAATNPTNRFESLHVEAEEPLPGRVRTLYLRDDSRSVLSRNDSPDVPFDVSLNPYRGCEHGCIYCYARPTHEYLGLSAGLDFESRILVKEDAPQLLRRALGEASWRPQPIGLSGVTDPYQPVERRLRITRGCLEVLAETRNPVMLLTKNALIERDVDLLAELAGHQAVSVAISITTLDVDLMRRMEPRTAHPRRRLETITRLSEAGIPVGVLMAPIVPAITDHEIPELLEATAEAGALFAGYTVLRLPGAVDALFSDWLEENFPDRKDKVLHRLEAMRGGKHNEVRFGDRMRGRGTWADQIRTLFETSRRRVGLARRGVDLSVDGFRRPEGRQRRLFE